MNMGHPEGESMRMGFDGGIKLEFHGAKVTSDGGLLAYRELDDALGLFDAVSTVLSDQRTGRNIQHAMPTLLRQSILPANELLHEQIRPLLTRPVGRPPEKPIICWPEFRYQAGSWDRPRWR